MKIKSKPIHFNTIYSIIIILSLLFIFYFIAYTKTSISYDIFFGITDFVVFVIIVFLEIKRRTSFVFTKNFLKKGISLYLYLLLFIIPFWILYYIYVSIDTIDTFVFSSGIILKQLLLLVFIFIIRGFYAQYVYSEKLNVQHIVLIGFISLIVIGSFLLYEPFSVYKSISFIDALFTSTSAVCVTGLIVKDTPQDFTGTGLLIILLLIQFGGLGIMLLYATFILLVSGNFSIKGYSITRSALEVNTKYNNLPGLIQSILFYTITVELVGAVILAFRFYSLGFTFEKALHQGAFHAISAFCNAGFSLFSNSLISYNTDKVITITVISLITAGGIGFLVGMDIIYITIQRIKGNPNYHLTAQSKMVVYSYFILNVLGTVLFMVFESSNTVKGYQNGDKILISLFQAVTARTAGFNSVDIGQLKSETLLLLDILMFVGASSGSTGGGVKVTTFTVLMITFLAFLRDRKFIVISKYRLAESTIRKAISIFLAYLIFVLMWTVFILVFEKFSIEQILFEVISAYGTVGLSTGITPALSSLSKMFIIFAMFIGRVGPLTLLIIMSGSSNEVTIKYPYTEFMIG